MAEIQHIPIPSAFEQATTRHREKIEVLIAAGFFETTHGKFTVHLNEDKITGVQVEKWAYQQRRELSTTPRLAQRKILP